MSNLTLSILILLSLLYSCGDNQNDSQVYVGAYRSLDEIIPYPYIIEHKNDSVFLHNSRGYVLEGKALKSITEGDTLALANKRFLLNYKDENYLNIFDLNDTLNFPIYNGNPNQKSRARFEKISSKENLDIGAFQNSISNGIWRYEVVDDENCNPNRDLFKEQLLKFDTDSLNILTNYYYEGQLLSSEYEKKGYSFFQVNNYGFLSFYRDEDNPQPLFQISNFDSNNIELIDFSSRDIKTIKFRKVEDKILDYPKLIQSAVPYSKCFDGYQGEYYYGDDVTYKKGNQYIQDFVGSEAPEKDMESGYIIIHFNVNCNGNLGNFGLIQMNRKYESSSFSIDLVGHLFEKLKLLKEWPSSNSTMNWLNYKDTHAFLMFKIENGKITDVLP